LPGTTAALWRDVREPGIAAGVDDRSEDDRVRTPWTVGVDVMPYGRVGERHARAILNAEEVDVLGRIEPMVAPSVAWTIRAYWRALARDPSYGTHHAMDRGLPR
jgi:hypothetical protein